MRSWLVPLAIVATCFVSGCASHEPIPFASTTQLASDAAILEATSRHLEAIDKQAATFEKQATWKKRGFFDAQENEAAEGLLFRFVVSHDALSDLATHYRKGHLRYSDDDARAKGLVISLTASAVLAYHTAEFVRTFHDDKVALYAEEDPAASDHRARILLGEDGKKRVRELFED